MKKAIVILALTATIFSCQKATETKEFKTAYVDTMELLKNYDEAKDIETKYKEKAKNVFDKYWMTYETKNMAKEAERKDPFFSNIASYKKWIESFKD